MIVYLSKENQEIQKLWSTFTNWDAWLEKRKNSHGLRKNKFEQLGGEDLKNRLDGWGAELAVRQAFNFPIEWDSPHGDYEIDIPPDIEVRGQPLNWYGLKFRPNDPLKRIWIAVSWQNAPRYKIIGWAKSEYLNQQKYWNYGKRKLKNKERSWEENPCALCPPEDLNSDFSFLEKRT